MKAFHTTKSAASLGVALGLALAQTANAESAAALAARIANYGLSAAVNGGVVTATGEKTDANSTLNLEIDDGVSVVWKASLTGSTSGASPLIAKSGGGSFDVQSGKVEQTGAAYAVSSGAGDGGGDIIISGGSVSSASHYAVYHRSNGTLSVIGTALVSSASRSAIYNNSQGVVNIGGGTVSTASTASSNQMNQGNAAIYNSSTGSVNISGGVVSAVNQNAVFNLSSGKITVSGDAVLTSASATNDNVGTVFLQNAGRNDNETLAVIGGTIENTAAGCAVYNNSYDAAGVVRIGGGTVRAAAGSAIISDHNGKIVVSGGAVAASGGSGGTIRLIGGSANVERLIMTGGSVENTAAGSAVYNYSPGSANIGGGTVSSAAGVAVYNGGNGSVNISGGKVLSVAGVAVFNSGIGIITVSGGAVATSANASASGGTIYLSDGEGWSSAQRLIITGGTVENTAAAGNAVYNASAGAVSIGGGCVLAKDGYAVYKGGAGATTLTGGVAFAYGTGVGDVIYGEYDASGGGAIAAWNKAAGTAAYYALSKNDIFVTPSPAASAAWNGRGGIEYANGESAGFFAVEGVVISKLTGSFVSRDAVNTAYTPTLKLGDVGLDDGYAWTNPETPLSVASSGQSFAAAFSHPSGNYTTELGDIVVNVEKAKITKPSEVNTALVYTGAAQSAGIAENDAYTVTGGTATNAGGYNAVVALIDKANYEWTDDGATDDFNLPWTIAKAPGAAVAAPTEAGKTHNSVSINAVVAASGQAVEYAISATDDAPADSWQTGLTFAGLLASMDYYIFARSAEDANHNAGAASTALEVRTDDATPIKDIQKSDGRAGIKLSNNVVSDKADIEVVLDGDRAGETKVVIFDNVGNVVFERAVRGAKFSWDLTNGIGRSVANGTYLFVAQVKGDKGTYAYSAKVGVKR